MKKDSRIIGRYRGQEDGPLMIVFGGMHGNEPAGVKAIDLICKMVEVEPITNPAFKYKGSILGLIGNKRAYKKNKRYCHSDLNRMWHVDYVKNIMSTPKEELKHEDLEIKELMEVILNEIEEVKPKRVVVLDLHTTSSYGGIFTIPTEDDESFRIALELHAPVVKGMLRGISGTTLHFFNKENLGVDTVAVTFESGQHNEQLSINRAIAAITNCMRSIGSVNIDDVENRHDLILEEYSKTLPKVVEMVSRYGVEKGDKFKMEEGFKNFEEVNEGEILAYDKNGAILAEEDALILMPLYQKQGGDGFFIVKRVEGF